MRTLIVTRRQALRGAGGFTLGLPFLPSLVPVRAWAAEPVLARQPAFFAMTTDNGGLWDANMFPGDDVLTDSQEIAAGHVVRRGRLVRRLEGSDAVLSPVLRAPASELTERLAGKLCALRGLDVPFDLGHNRGGTLGYYNSGEGTKNISALQGAPFPTIDQVMAWSPSFYRTLAGVRQRSVNTGSYYTSAAAASTSFNYSNPAAKTGVVQGMGPPSSASRLFDKLFLGGESAPATTAAPRPRIVDRVIQSYRNLRDGNRRLSGADRQRLEDHIAQLAELERSLAAVPAFAGCRETKAPSPPPGSTPGDRRVAYQLQNSVIAAAFLCGYTRIAVMQIVEAELDEPSYRGDWHQEVAHQWIVPGAQGHLVSAYRGIFRHVFLDLMRKLEVEESPGVTCLDNAVMVWTQECSEVTHNSKGIQVIVGGGGRGALRAGSYCDYRNRDKGSIIALPQHLVGKATPWRRSPGLTWNRYMATVLQAVGLPRAEYERNGAPGYGNPHHEAGYDAAWSQSGDFLPFLRG